MYAVADLNAPYLYPQPSLAAAWRETIGWALCGIYRETATGWKLVAKRMWGELEHVAKKQEPYEPPVLDLLLIALAAQV